MMESERRTLSVIERLMGLDELSPHQPVQKRQRLFSENYRKRVASIGVREKRNLSDEKGKVNLSGSKEVHDTMGVVDSKIELFMKYLQEPEYLITAYLPNLQGFPHHSVSGHVPLLKSSHASDYGKIDMCRKSGPATGFGRPKLLQKDKNGLVTDPHRETGLGNRYKFVRSQMESNDGVCLPPAETNVLKPNLENTENAARCFSSSSSHLESHATTVKHKDFPSPENRNSYVEEKQMKNVTNDVKLVQPRSRFSKEIARQTGHIKSSLSTKVSESRIRGSDTFEKVSGLTTFSFPDSSNWKNQYQPSFYHSDGSFVAREKKNEILEGRKITKRSQEVEMDSQGGIPSEMFSMPDHESRPQNLDVEPSENGLSSQIDLCNDWLKRPLASAYWLQHRSRKQGHNKKDDSQSRNSGSTCMISRSSPSLESGNSYSVQDTDGLQGDLKRKHEEKITCQQISLVLKSSSCSGSEHRHTVQENRVVQEERKNMLKERDPSEQISEVTKSSVASVPSASIAADIDMVRDAETGIVSRSSEDHKEQYFEPIDCTLLMEGEDDSPQVPQKATQQGMSIEISEEDSASSFCFGTDLEFFIKSEEAYQPSPSSVLESLFEKDISCTSSKCFQGVNAKLHGLQLQIELLKSKSSGAYSEGSGMMVSSDDESEEGSVGNYEEHEELARIFSGEESRDFSYLVDIFAEAGFHGRDSNMGYDTWHSPECVISPSVFETLEKKYGELMSWTRSERRLLFDRINSELIQILQPSIVMHWKKPVSNRLSFTKNIEAIEESLWMLLASQEKEANKDSSVKMMGKDDKWLELGNDIEVIVTEIENSLIDELAAEVVSMENF